MTRRHFSWTSVERIVGRKFGAGRRGVLAIASATAIGQTLTVASAPVLSRLYNPNHVGVFAVVLALALPLGSVAALRIEAAIPIAEEDEQAYSLVWLAMATISLTSITSTVVIILFRGNIARAMQVDGSTPWLLTIPIIAAIAGLILVMGQLAIRQRRYGTVGRRTMWQAATTSLVQVLNGTIVSGPGGLTFGYLAGQLAGLVGLTRGAGLMRPVARRGVQSRKLIQTAHRFRRFPLLLAPAGLLNALGLQLPVLLLAYHYGPAEAGWFGMTQRVLALPVALVAAAVAQVYLGELARVARSSPRTALTLFYRSSRTLAIVGIAVAMVVAVSAQSLFPLLLGKDWATSGEYGRAISIGLATQIIASPLASTLTVLEKGLTQLLCDLGRVTAMVTVVATVSHAGGSALTAVWLLTLVTTAFYVTYWCLSWHALRQQIKHSEATNS